MTLANNMRKISFLTGTRADFGKLKSLIEVLRLNPLFEVHIFATGMHMDKKYGYTVHEIEKCGYENVFKYINHQSLSSMSLVLARTIEGYSNYVDVIQPDLIVVHGDRVEALAGATVGALNNTLVAHIEGGELSGTVDELIRHAVSKLSHTHFVANEEAKKRLQQMGEKSESIFVIGSPDMDAMKSDTLPSLEEVKKYYEIPFKNYAISLFHPVTTEFDEMDDYAEQYVKALEESGCNYIVIYPNNDNGSDFILSKIMRLKHKKRFRVFPSVRFESFLSMMENAQFVVGNSSAGIREAPFYGVPTVNVGSRQNGRTQNGDIIHTGYEKEEILEGIEKALQLKVAPRSLFGDGNSDELFNDIISDDNFWNTAKQKTFSDVLVF
ncbi:MAG: neuC [Segetibacter sp.]|nr:neuC [Segetibacter sp.]